MTGPRPVVSVERITALETWPLRREVLRNHLPEASTRFPGDDHALVAHFGVRLVHDGGASAGPAGASAGPAGASAGPALGAGPDRLGAGADRSGAGADRSGEGERQREVVAVGSIYPEAPPWEPEHVGAWRIRGMATRPDVRRRGLGRLVLESLISVAVGHDGDLVWCHARIGAVDFYRRAGFTTIAEPFDDGIAVHVSMWRPLEPVG
jgi:ribosomal protein S18 acetylase RimI-like enzyme